jgi:hypothetical protein
MPAPSTMASRLTIPYSFPNICAARALAGGSNADGPGAGYSIWLRAGRGGRPA